MHISTIISKRSGLVVLLALGFLACLICSIPVVRTALLGFAVRSQLVPSEQTLALSTLVASPVPTSSESLQQSDIQYVELRTRISALEATVAVSQKQLAAAIAELTTSNDAYQKSLAQWQADQQKLVASADVSSQRVDSPGSPQESTTTRINLNAATAEQLDSLPGVGPSLAQKIISYRADHRFSQVDDLIEVSGIGEALLSKIRDLVSV